MSRIFLSRGIVGAFASVVACLALWPAASSAAPVAELTPAFHGFGEVFVDTETDHFDFTLSNTGDGEVTVVSVAKGGNNPGQFKIKNATTCETGVVLDTVNPSCRVRVTFDPGNDGTKTATIEVVTDLSPTPLTVEVTGTAVNAPTTGAAVSSIAVPFDSRRVEDGPSDPRTVYLSSTGSIPLEVGAITVSGPDAADFATDAQSCGERILQQNEPCAFTVTFDPSTAGSKRAQVSIPSSAPGSPIVVGLAGIAIASPPPPGTARIKIAAKLPRATRGGKLKVPVTCATVQMERCAGKVVATARGEALHNGKGGRFMVARGSFSVTPGRHTVTLRLEPRAVRSLRRQSKFKAFFVSTTKQATGESSKSTGSRFIKAPQRRSPGGR